MEFLGVRPINSLGRVDLGGQPPGLPGPKPWIEPEPVVDADGVQGLKVADVFPGSAAEKAGLHAGDVIHSINGYLTAKRDDLAWIMANEAPDGVVKMSVRTASDGKVHTITAQLAVEPGKTSRPSSLPPVGNGPPPASR